MVNGENDMANNNGFPHSSLPSCSPASDTTRSLYRVPEIGQPSAATTMLDTLSTKKLKSLIKARQSFEKYLLYMDL